MDTYLAEQVVETAAPVVASGAISAQRARQRQHPGAGLRRDVLHRRSVVAQPPARGCRPGRSGRRAARGRPAADPGRGGRDAHRDVRRPARRRLRAPHPLALRHGVRRRAAADRLLDRGAGDVRTSDRHPGRRRTARAARTRPSPTSAPPSCRTCRRCCSPTTASSSSTARPSWPSWSAGWSRRPPRPGSTPARIGGPVELPEDMRAAALQRAMAYAAAGTAHS